MSLEPRARFHVCPARAGILPGIVIMVRRGEPASRFDLA